MDDDDGDDPSTGSGRREQDVVQAFASLAAKLTDGHDIATLLDDLTGTCAQLLDVRAAGLLLADRRGVLQVLSASSEELRSLEVFQLEQSEGPCRDCYLSERPVSVADLGADRARWPAFGRAAEAAGFASVHVRPMRMRGTSLGALGLFGGTTGSLSRSDLQLAQALADVATVMIVQDRSADDSQALNAQLQGALSSRVILEQAKGLLAQSGQLDMPGAFAVLRKYARDHNRKIAEVAQALVDRDLAPEAPLEHFGARQQSRRPRV